MFEITLQSWQKKSKTQPCLSQMQRYAIAILKNKIIVKVTHQKDMFHVTVFLAEELLNIVKLSACEVSGAIFC